MSTDSGVRLPNPALRRWFIDPRRWVAATLSPLPLAALAHHPMGGSLPSTLGEGLLSGLGHPIIGLDHFLFVLALGVLCWRLGIGLRSIAAFVGGSLLGIVLHLSGTGIPANESMVALTLIAVGVCLWSGGHRSRSALAVSAVVAGAMHGYAYGESIVGVETDVLLSYLAGLVLVQSMVGIASFRIVTMLASRQGSQDPVSRWTGDFCC
jgi:urease accessory protein